MTSVHSQRRARLAIALMFLQIVPVTQAQSPGSAGTIDGTVTDPSGAGVPGAQVVVQNVISGFTKTIQSDASGAFHLQNLPPNSYHLEVTASGFAPASQDIAVRSAVPIALNLKLTLAGSETRITVEGGGNDLLENVPYAHNDVDREVYSKLPLTSPGSGLSDAILLSSPGVVADSNGLIHPLGDHAQITYSFDGQPISDQQSKQFSTQLPLNAIQSMELITGGPGAEFGDKTSLVVNATTRSGLGQTKPTGSVVLRYGSFGDAEEETSIGFGSAKMGNFLVANASRSGRFLDTPEFRPFHAKGNNETVFDRFDYNPSGRDAFHLNLFQARNWFQIPNTLDQPDQDQRQRVLSYNVAPGYQHTFNTSTLLTVNPFVRLDQLNYYPSRDLFADSPATLGQDRRLLNYGVKSDISYVHGVNNIKVGLQIMQTRLQEHFSLALTDPLFNAPCVDANNNPQALPNVTDPGKCAGAGFVPNTGLQPGLVPYDITRGGQPFDFRGKANISQYAFYVQDTLTLGNLNFTPGLRIDRYDGISQDTGIEPRIGVSYNIKKTSTVLRGSFSRTFETPYNENLVLSSSTGQGGLATNVFGGVTPLKPGNRNQFNVGLQQTVSKYLLIDADYFWKFTNNAFDFSALLNSPVQFPIEWKKSKIDGVALRLSTTNFHGFQANVTMGHTRSRFFAPEVGGLLFDSPLNTTVFRIDHDQAFEQTVNLRYQMPKAGPWFALTVRHDSGLVAGAVPDVAAATALSGAQQSVIGFFCGDQVATAANPITSCTSNNYGATRLVIPAAGTADADHNPPRIRARNILDLSIGTDNLTHAERYKTNLKFTAVNLGNEHVLYNFLSTFSGTHWVTPRAFQAEVGFNF